MNWFSLSILSVFALATAELTQQHLLNKDNALNERASAVFTFVGQSILALIILLLTPIRNQIFDIFQNNVVYRVLFVNIIASFGMVFYFRSFKVKNISISTIFVSLSAIISTILGIIFFGESIHILKFLGIALILGAIIALNYKNLELEKNHFYGLLAGCLFGVTFTLDKSLVTQIHPLVYIFWAFFMTAFFGFIFNPRSVINSVANKPWKTFVPVFISGLAYLFYNVFTFFAYRLGGEVGKVDAINNSQIFLIIAFEFLILKHTKSTGRKIVTALIAFTGVLILGLK
jgi:drug/metabolite transporter (DMT)-like permease